MNRRKFMQSGSLSAALALNTLPLPAMHQASNEVKKRIKLKEIRYVDLKFPGKVPLTWNAIKKSGGGSPKTTFLELHTDQGIIGRSLPKGPRSIVLGDIRKRIIGQNLLDVERIWHRMYWHDRKPVAKGAYIKAIGSVDMAIWDIVGKALELPVYKILGAYNTNIRVYAAGGYYAEGKSVAKLVAEMEGYVNEGFTAVKMKVGGASLREDVERVAAVRSALGPDIDILIDANNKWKAYEAIRFGRAVEKFDLFWFEEPVVPDDFAGCAEVRNALDIPIVAGENEFTRWGCRDLIAAGSADILNLDTVKAGGITEYRRIAALASAFHVPVSPHGNAYMAVHLVASLPNALIMETYPGHKWQHNPALPGFKVKNGYVSPPDSPGLGLEPDPLMVKKYKV